MKKILFFCLIVLAFALPSFGQSFADTVFQFGPGNCGGNVSANFVVGAAAGAGTGLQAVGTAFTAVYQVASSAAATDIIGCIIPFETRTTPGKTTTVAGVAFFYGPITTAPTSEAAPTCVTLSMPAPATGETGSVAAGTNVPLTSIPVVGSANLTALTTGQFYTTYLAFTTPPTTTQYGLLQCALTFVQGAAAAMQVNTPGGLAFSTFTIGWMKQHGHDPSVNAMMRMGIAHETAELIFAHYVPKNKKAIAYMAAYNQRQQDKALAAMKDRISYGPMAAVTLPDPHPFPGNPPRPLPPASR